MLERARTTLAALTALAAVAVGGVATAGSASAVVDGRSNEVYNRTGSARSVTIATSGGAQLTVARGGSLSWQNTQISSLLSPAGCATTVYEYAHVSGGYAYLGNRVFGSGWRSNVLKVNRHYEFVVSGCR